MTDCKTSITEIANKQKEKWCELETLIEAVARRRDLIYNPQVVPEIKEKKCGMKVNPWKTAVHMHQKKYGPPIPPKSIEPEPENFLHGPNTTVKMGRLDLFAPPKRTTVYSSPRDVNNNCGKETKNTTTQCPTKHKRKISLNLPETTNIDETWPSKMINYILPIETFNNFKVLVPKNKIQVRTDDGEVVVVDRDNENCLNGISLYGVDMNTATKIKSNNVLKRHKKSLSVLELLTRERVKNKDITRWEKEGDSYVYFGDDKKFTINCETGEITCVRREQKVLKSSVPTLSDRKNENQENIPKLARNLFIPRTCYSLSSSINNSLDLYQSIKSKQTKRSQCSDQGVGRLGLKRLKENQYIKPLSYHFVICGTKFGSFIERLIPDKHVNSDHSYIKKDFKVEEEQLLLAVKECLPSHCQLDNSRLGILKSSISFIQELERKLKESLHIIKPLTIDESMQTSYNIQQQQEISQKEFYFSPFPPFDFESINSFKSLENPLTQFSNEAFYAIQQQQLVPQQQPHTPLHVTQLLSPLQQVPGDKETEHHKTICEQLYEQFIESVSDPLLMQQDSLFGGIQHYQENKQKELKEYFHQFVTDMYDSREMPLPILESVSGNQQVPNGYDEESTYDANELLPSETYIIPPENFLRFNETGIRLESKETQKEKNFPTESLQDTISFLYQATNDQTEEHCENDSSYNITTQEPLLSSTIKLRINDIDDNDGVKLGVCIDLPFGGDDSNHGDARKFQLNYIDVNLNSLSCKNDGMLSPVNTTPTKVTNYSQQQQEYYLKPSNNDTTDDLHSSLFSPTSLSISSCEFNITSP